jgi:anthranilate phosphoribosyltransferase
MTEIMTGVATPAQTAAYITALSIKGETVDEIAASAKAMRAVSLKTDIPDNCIDIVGTGGDKSNSFNISTCSSIVVAASGVSVAKHGNRSVSSKCGAADVLDALGANLKVDAQKGKQVFDKCNFMFLHAQVYHPAMRYAAPVRAELGIRTIFNILGPLANPAGCKKQLLGVYSKELLQPLAKVLTMLGANRVIAVHGEEGLDEVSPSGKTYCCQIFDGQMKEYVLTPADFGLAPHDKSEIVGGDPATNAGIMKDVLNGKKGAYRDAVLENSALALYTAGAVNNVKDGVKLAQNAIDSGKALATLNTFIAATNS